MLEGRICLTATFVAAPLLTSGEDPTAVVVGDFNGDGKPDIAVTNDVDNTVSVFLGVGNGTFIAAPGSPIAVGRTPTSIVTGDFNGDGHLDLAVINQGDNTLSVLLGRGDGTFTLAPGSPFQDDNDPVKLTVGDFNGDGKPDLAVANSNGPLSTISIMLGNGDGSFVAAPDSPFPTADDPSSIVSGDFNGDGKADLAIASGGLNVISVFLGQGDGTFVSAPDSSPGGIGANGPASLVEGDFNGDGKTDLAFANQGNGTVGVVLGNGDGTFTAAPGSPITVGTSVGAVAVGDFDGDGKTDLAVIDQGAGNVNLLLGQGNGTFVADTGSPFAITGLQPQFVTVGDFNGDGKPDLAIPAGANTVNILLNTSKTIPTPTPTTTVEADIEAVQAEKSALVSVEQTSKNTAATDKANAALTASADNTAIRVAQAQLKLDKHNPAAIPADKAAYAAAKLKSHEDAAAAKSKVRLDKATGNAAVKLDEQKLKIDERQLRIDEKAARTRR